MSKGPARLAFVAKKGKLRKVQKRPATVKTKQSKKVPYVRAPRDLPARGVRMERSLWKRSMPELLSASNTQIVQMLQEDGLLPDWHGKACPHCWKGKLSSKTRNDMLQYRCTANKCGKFVVPHYLHPLFQGSSSCTHKPLQLQAALLLLRLTGIKTAAARLLFHVNHKMYESLGKRLDVLRKSMLSERRRRSSSAAAALGLMLKQTNQFLVATFSQTRARNVCSGSNGLALCREGSPRHCC